MNKKLISHFVWIFSLSFLIFSPFGKISGKEPSVTLGIDYLEKSKFAVLTGKRVGLLTHPAGKNGMGESTVDVFVRSNEVNLVALFGPEHGIYGDEKASVPVDDKIDKKISRPKKFNEMLTISAKLSSSFLFCRVDLYELNNKVYFGEITIYPGGGQEPFLKKEMDLKMGELINLDLL